MGFLQPFYSTNCLPNINLVVQNVGSGPARDITFEFSAPIQSSDGFVLSDLNIFQEGASSLAPSTRITCYWDNLENLLPKLESKDGVPEHVEVTTRYKDLSGYSYETKWDIQSSIYEGIRNLDPKDMSDLVEAVEVISEVQTGKADIRANVRDGTRNRRKRS